MNNCREGEPKTLDNGSLIFDAKALNDMRFTQLNVPMVASYYKITIDGLPKPEERDSNDCCWWGWLGDPWHDNPKMWNTTWVFCVEAKDATYWAPHWSFPVLKYDILK